MTLDLSVIARAVDPSAKVKPGATSATVACPLCGYNTTSCSLAVKGDRLLVHCHAGCDQRELFAAVVEMARLGHDSRPAGARRPGGQRSRPAPDPEHWRRAMETWRGGCQVAESAIARRYLEGRRCVVAPAGAGHLRFVEWAFHWPSRTSWPALVGLVTDPGDPSARALTTHTTFLAADGSGKAPVEPQRLFAGGLPSGGVMQLWGGAGPDLGVGEGVETALSLAREVTPVWAALSAGTLADLPVVAGVEALIIAVDRDLAGERAAVACARRWKAAGVRVRLARPPAGDLNDFIKDAGL